MSDAERSTHGRPVTREQAREIALQYLRAGGHVATPAIRTVLTYAEVMESHLSPPGAYGLWSHLMTNPFIAYVDEPTAGLQSSLIVVVRRSDGQVVYFGRAADEG